VVFLVLASVLSLPLLSLYFLKIHQKSADPAGRGGADRAERGAISRVPPRSRNVNSARRHARHTDFIGRGKAVGGTVSADLAEAGACKPQRASA
jgi:hypothetical protein